MLAGRARARRAARRWLGYNAERLPRPIGEGDALVNDDEDEDSNAKNRLT